MTSQACCLFAVPLLDLNYILFNARGYLQHASLCFCQAHTLFEVFQRLLTFPSDKMGDHDLDLKGTSHTPIEPAPLRPRRRRGKDVERHACNICRERKVRCDRAFPKCGRCIRLREDCSYDSWTPGTALSQSAMARQLAELQQRLGELMTGYCIEMAG